MSIILEELHDRLVEELKRIGPQTVAKLTGISRATIYNWMEKGNTPLDKLALLMQRA
jgi:DNA invertase Pin-like site-specific DNA recombinase